MSPTNYTTLITPDEIKENLQIFTTLRRNKRSALIVPVPQALLCWGKKLNLKSASTLNEQGYL